MKFLDEGKYELRDAALLVEAEHDGSPCLVEIDRRMLEDRYNVTASGAFHEYWSSVLQNREELEAAAGRKFRDAQETIHLTTGDLQTS